MKFGIRSSLILTTVIGIGISTKVEISYAQADAAPETGLVIESNANQESNLLSPSKTLSGDELQNKLGSSLGATLSNELGVSATGFGAGASRPVIRAMYVAAKMLLNPGVEPLKLRTGLRSWIKRSLSST